ncbi:cerebrospinal fluid secretion [Pristimantis euphronides]
MEADNDGPVYDGGDLDLGISSDSLEDSDTDSLREERRYQSELCSWICNNHEDILQAKDQASRLKGKETTGNTEDLSHQGKGAKPNVRQQEIHTSYSELRYDPNWRKHQNLLHTSDEDEEEFQDGASIDSEPSSPNEMTLGTTKDQVTAEDHPFWKPLTDMTSKNKQIAVATRQKSNDSKQIRKSGAHQGGTAKKKVMAQGEVQKKDIIEKNKVTLGVRKKKTQSYLHIHKKKIEENTSEEPNEKSDVQPTEKVKLPEVLKETGSQIQENKPKTLYMAGALSDINSPQWDDIAFYSGGFDNDYMTFTTFPNHYKDSQKSLVGPYSSEEHLQFHNEGSYYQSIRAPKARYGYHVMKTMGAAEDSLEMYMHPRLFQTGPKSHLEAPGITYNPMDDVFMPSQIIPQTYAPTATSTKSNNERIAGARDKGSNERTRSCPARIRKTEKKHQQMLKSFLNEKLKLGGLGPVYTISEEKKEQLKQQKEYAKVIQEQNRSKPMKPREIQVPQNEKSTSIRQKSLEYAKKVPRPQLVPKVSSEKRTDVPERRAVSYDSLFPQLKLLEDLQVRHEKEKMAVAALNALHIL